ncbi:MAG: GtrA family protein [Planctomycetaceae bacterium]|nr:GtrA family protein [Planctomycetaceae bacterium]
MTAEPENNQPPAGEPKKDPGTRVRFIIYMVISYCSMQGTIYLLYKKFGIEESIAAGIAVVLVSLMNFFWLMIYVYRTADGHRWRQFWKYLHSIVGFRIWELVVFAVLHELLGIHPLVSSTIMQAQSVVMKYFVYNKLVFSSKKHPDAEELAIHDIPPEDSDD